MLSFIIFIFILSILILVHEWGHYITAVKCGVKVEQFALGFGPKLFGWRRGDTEFCLCAIPLGGFVKMAGDERGNLTGHSHEFFSQSVGARALIVLMGPVVNLILAFACFYVVFMIGFVDMDATAKKVPAVVGQVLADSPAEHAGLKKGDEILTIDGKAIAHWPQLQDVITASTNDPIVMTVKRPEGIVSLNVNAKLQMQKDIFGRTKSVRRIGVGPNQVSDANQLVIKRYGPLEAFKRAGQELGDITVKTYVALYEMLTGARSPKEAMGIVGMFFVIKFAITVGFSFVLHIVGVISASLAIFNLLPVIPLDGGHLFLLAIEKLRGKALSQAIDGWMGRIGFGLILALAAFVFYADFERIGLVDKVIKIFHGGS